VIWTCLEGSAIIVAVSLPVLQPLADRYLPKRTNQASTATDTEDAHHLHSQSSRVSAKPWTTFPSPLHRLTKLESRDDGLTSTASQPRTLPDLERGKARHSTRSRASETIEVERAVEVQYTWERNGLALPGAWMDSGDNEYGLRITKDTAPDGTVTTTVAVTSSALYLPGRDRYREWAAARVGNVGFY
jgi:hypothetical protein